MQNREEERVPLNQGQRHNQPENNLRDKILKGSFYVLTFSMAVLALALSSITLHISQSQSQSDKIDIPPVVKYTTYERIGNKDCPKSSGTSLIYSGITISYSFNNNTPSSYSGFRCMPTDAKDIAYYTENFMYEQEYSGAITEYITFTDSNHHDAACAVCMIEGRGSIVVLPSTYVCKNSSWTKEYNGYLMTGNMCVDREMQAIDGSGDPTRAAFLRHEAISKKISPKYQDKNVLSCVVCSM